MSVAGRTRRLRLTAYEKEQVRRIAAWKSEPPNPLTEFWKRLSLPAARAIEKLIPDTVIRAAIEKSYDVSDLLAGQEEIRRRAGVDDLEELCQGSLERCDELAAGVRVTAESVAAVEGGVTGAGGILTTFLDVPLLFILSLATIRRVGHCYGYPLDQRRGRHFVLGILIAAMAGSLKLRRERVGHLHELEDLLIEETQEDIVTEEALSFLFQIEVFEDVPGVGVASGAALNWFFMRRVAETARMVFQERWLRDNGKVDAIEPAEVHERYLAGGWSGLIGRAAYSGFYGLGYGVALPVYAMASWVRPADNVLVRGLRDGAANASRQASLVAERVVTALDPAEGQPEATAPAMA